MKNRKSYSRCPAVLAVLTVCSTVLFLFSSCGSGNGKPSSVGSDDPADTYRGYLSEIRRLDHLTAKELAGHLKRWQTVKDSVFARLRRDTLGLPGSDACKVCEGIHDSLRIEFSGLALSAPRTYGELLMLKERLSPYAADEELRRARQDESNRHYAKSWLAIALPVIYCLLDALGTFADSRVLEKLGEELADACNVAYELTFLVMGIACAIYVLGIKKQRLIPKQEGPKYLGAVCETIGQFFYIYALADTEHVAFAAPIISSYCVASVIWGRIFLKEKLSKKHYACIALVVAGIIIMGILDI